MDGRRLPPHRSADLGSHEPPSHRTPRLAEIHPQRVGDLRSRAADPKMVDHLAESLYLLWAAEVVAHGYTMLPFANLTPEQRQSWQRRAHVARDLFLTAPLGFSRIEVVTVDEAALQLSFHSFSRFETLPEPEKRAWRGLVLACSKIFSSARRPFVPDGLAFTAGDLTLNSCR